MLQERSDTTRLWAAWPTVVRRDDIIRGAADLGVDLDEHIAFVIAALQPIATELDLVPESGAAAAD